MCTSFYFECKSTKKNETSKHYSLCFSENVVNLQAEDTEKE